MDPMDLMLMQNGFDTSAEVRPVKTSMNAMMANDSDTAFRNGFEDRMKGFQSRHVKPWLVAEYLRGAGYARTVINSRKRRIER